MNQGLYGMASGGGASGSRKVIFRPARNSLIHSNPIVNWAVPSGITLQTVTPTVAVRTRLVNISGRGAIRFAAIETQSATTSAQTLELVLDGVVVQTCSTTTNGVGQALVAAGLFSSTTIPIPDFMVFDTSAELYVTQSVSITIYSAIGYELHQ